MPTPGNSINEQSASGLVNFNGTATFGTTALIQHDVLVGATSNTITNITNGTTGQFLGANTGADPSWQSVPGGVSSVQTANATPQFVLSGGVETVDFNLRNLVLGSTLPALSGGLDNVGMGGNGILAALTTGSQNVVIGASAARFMTSGGGNVLLGYQAGDFITQGTNNVLIGTLTGTNLSTSTSNTAVGAGALFAFTTGSSSTGSNTAVGQSCLGNISTGINNIALGQNSGNQYTLSNSSNICIGNQGLTGESNAIRIGTQGSSTGQQNLCFIAGITGATVTGSAVLCSVGGQLGTIASSTRYKENIKDIKKDVSILDLRPVEFNYIKDDSKTKKYGLIAEEVEKSFPYLVLYNDEKQPETVMYHELPVLLLAEIKKLNKRIEKLEKSFK